MIVARTAKPDVSIVVGASVIREALSDEDSRIVLLPVEDRPGQCGSADGKLTMLYNRACLVFGREDDVTTMAMLGKIRRLHFRDKMKLSEIARRTRPTSRR